MSSIPITEPKQDLKIDRQLANYYGIKANTLNDVTDKVMTGINTPNMRGLGTDYAVTNKFVLYVPIQNVLGPQFSALELNLLRFSIPQVLVGSTSASFKGYSAELPTGVINPDVKEVTFEYVVDANWANYRALYCWAANIGVVTPVTLQDLNYKSKNRLLPVRVYLLDLYKRKVIEFIYENCWIKVFQDLALDYTQQPDEVKHSFTCAYTNFAIADVIN